jgi:antibiotic biosynthesis monooxygenase (ABM) superfamily enzyme
MSDPRFSRVRFTIAAVLAAYPLVTALLYLILPLTPEWALWQKSLVIVPLVVSTMIWLLIPRIQRHLKSWLHV